ncbi:MAG: dephospho-CoA kinase [Actinobacteria bacterium]|nr:dephospho-CoA kinase [Actinomycetota bacterium]
MRLGLTGGIGSGKSSVARLLAERGASVVDADAIAREVVGPGSVGLAQLVDAFGTQIRLADGSLDRAVLAEVAFASAEGKATLNAITHPLITQRTGEVMASVPHDAVLVHDIPLLTELGLQGGYDLVVVVDCPDDIRVHRLLERGLTEDDARARIAAQATREQRLAIADVVIDNSGGWEELSAQVDVLWQRITAEATESEPS